jgi:cob(I)alamin adenosyltransferase
MPEPGADGASDDVRRPAIYTKTGDDGTTGLLFGGRVAKDSAAPAAYGDVDEAQAAIGAARAAAGAESALLDTVLVEVARDLWVLMAELATAPENRHKLQVDTTLVSGSMVDSLERRIDEVAALFVPPSEFVVPGEDLPSALLDLARTIVRRAERSALSVAAEDSAVVPYLNRLSDLLWTLARWREGESRRVRDI